MNGRGLSPFSSFSVNLASLYDPAYFPPNPRGAATSILERADQIIVVMDVEYRQVGPERSLTWISTCR